MNDKMAERRERQLREGIASLPLHERQQFAREVLKYRDGMPYTEGEIRDQLRRFRTWGMARDEAIRTCSVADPTKRRIGSLNPEEVAVIAVEVWAE